ncbi:MAG: putative bifunctional diguanylate cyclase/phosphodiesterase [Acidimicrobiia bacterium]
MKRAALGWYVTAISVAAIAVAVPAAAAVDMSHPFGIHPASAITFAVLAFIAEARPMPWLSRQDGGEVTASWTFTIALLLCVPVGTALLVCGLNSAIIEIARRKLLSRTVFNVANEVFSLAIAAALMSLLTEPEWMLGSGVRVAWWAAAAFLSGGAAMVANSAFTCAAIAISQRASIAGLLRTGLLVNLTMDGLLLALAPIFVIVVQRSLLLAPLLLTTVWAVYKSGNLALRNRHDAIHDMLTGLPNRRHFTTHGSLIIESAGRRRRRAAVVHLDLNGFKAINDRLGHHMGDQVLCEAADRLRRSVRNVDLLARLGGDEFAIILTEVSEITDAESAVRRMASVLSEPLEIEGIPVCLEGSFGVALFPDHGADLNAALQSADLAMYAAKADGGGVRAFAPEDADIAGGMSLVSLLPEAIRSGQLDVAFLPCLDLTEGRVTGAEALLRWHHPTLGDVPPLRYIGAAEQTEVIVDVTAFVLGAALATAAGWSRAGLDLGISVNVSARNLQEPGFVQTVRDALELSGVAPERLDIELTEHALIADFERCTRVLERLRTLGVRVSLDDFGTGYSSLSMLRSLPVDRIKLDRSFVSSATRNARDASIVRSMIDLAHRLDMVAVAEGVEDHDTLTFLRDAGCDEIQGHLLSPADAADQVEAMAGRRFDWASVPEADHREAVPQ